MSESTDVFQYRIYCVQEAAYVYVWGTTAPTLCPNDHADRTLDATKTTVTNTVSEKHVFATEPYNGYFQATTIPITVPSGDPGDIYTQDVSFPMNITMWTTGFRPQSSMVGDMFCVLVAPNTTVDVVTQTVNIGDTVLHVTGAMCNNTNIVLGNDISITDGTNTNHLDRITELNTANNTITITEPPTVSFAAGSVMKLNIQLVRDYMIDQSTENIEYARKGLRGKTLPANTILRVMYHNNTGTAKTFYFNMEYYY